MLEVRQGSPADNAGFMSGDVILRFNNRPVKDVQDLFRYTQQAGRGRRASITVLRYQQESTVSIALE